MDITPRIAAGRQLVTAYGNGGFRINNQAFKGSVLVFPDRAIEWPIASMDELTADSLSQVAEATPPVEVLLVGCGASLAFIRPEIREPLREAGIVIDGMDTGAACRTYNVLLSEERRIAAALIAIE